MENIFEKLILSYETIIEKEESSWFNGRAYFPIIRYRIRFSIDNWSFTINYENRISEFNKKQYIDGGTFNTRHVYNIQCLHTKKQKLDNFGINENGIFSKLFWKEKKYTFKSRNLNVQKMLNDSNIINELFHLNDSEFSPSIFGKNSNEDYQIYINFNLSKHDELYLIKNINSCISIISILKKEISQ